MKKIASTLTERLEKIISSMGCEFWGCELSSEGRRTVFRIYIDSPGGVTIDHCSQVSRQVSALMDVLDPLPGGYTLEVSSPGSNRPLFNIEHYRKYVGRCIKARLYVPINDRRQYKGLIQRVEDDNIYVLLEDTELEVKLPFSAIEKANLIE